MPAIAHQNKILGNTSGGGSTILVTTSESSLYGQTITLSDGTTTLSGTFSNTGECEFAGVMMTGTLTLACGGVSQSISVPYFGNYSFVFSLFSATVNVTYPYTEGATCTLSDGTTTLIATGSPMAFTVPNAGAWTASVELDGNTKTTTTYITTDGQVASINIVFGTINVTYENDFKGVSITCTLGATTITKTAPTTGNTMSFYPPTTGQWTISGTVGGIPYPTTANVTSLSTPVSVNLETIPNGSTATPTDVVQTWLKCAGINDKNYTTVAQVLGDSTTLLALISDNNAVDYMVRSTTWASDVCADSTAMTDIGANNYCANTLLADSTWRTAICNSTYFESVLNVKVPVMTSNTTPSGECISSGALSGYSEYKAFDGVESGSEYTSSQTGTSAYDWAGYHFTNPVIVNRASLTGRLADSAWCAFDDGFEIQGSNDGSDWTTLATENKPTNPPSSGTATYYYDFDNDTAYSYYRMYGKHNGYRLIICEMQFYGRTTS